MIVTMTAMADRQAAELPGGVAQLAPVAPVVARRDKAAAEHWAERLVESHPGDLWALNVTARAYRALGDTASADAELARAQTIYERLGARRPTHELPHGLTRREYEVLTLVAEGRSNREIGAALFISDRTVARHLTNIYNKIGVTSRTQAARYAIEHQTSVSRGRFSGYA